MLDEIKSFFGADSSVENRHLTIDGSNDTFISSKTEPFSSVSEDAALKISALNAGINVIGDAVASLPVHIYKPTANGRERLKDDKRLRLLNFEPNNFTNAFTFKADLIRNLILKGNGYLFIDKSVTGEYENLFLIHPDNVQVKRKTYQNGDVDYTLYIYFADSKYMEVDLYDVVNVVQNSIDGVVGRGLLNMASDVLGLATEEMSYSTNIFKNGASLKGYLASETALSKEAKMNLSNSWKNFYSGSTNAGKTAVLENGLKFVPLTLSPADSKILESRRFTILEIARFLKIAPHLLGDLERATFSNITEQNLQFLHQTLNPYLRKIEQALNKSLLTEEEKDQGYYFEFDVSQLFRSNIKEMVETYAVGLEKGIFTVNEVRTAFNLTSIEGGDFLYAPLNLGQLKPDGSLINPNADLNKEETTPKEVNQDGKDGVQST